MVLPRKADPRQLRAQCSNRRPERIEPLVIRCAVAEAAPAGGGALRPVGARLLRSLRAAEGRTVASCLGLLSSARAEAAHELCIYGNRSGDDCVNSQFALGGRITRAK